MNVFLWILQVLLALHTAAGAMWKLFNSEQTVPSLKAIPHGAWQALIVFEIVCGLGLILPAFSRRLGNAPRLAAAGIGAEMLLFCGVSLASASADPGELAYWLVVAAVCAFIVYGRTALQPITRSEAPAPDPLSTRA